MTKYFKIIYTDDGRYIEYDINILQKKFDSSGFFAVASSTQDTLSETYNVLHQRDIIEKAFRALKSELDMDTLRVHSTERVYGKFFIAFLSSVLRYYIASYAKKTGLSTGQLINQLNLIELQLHNDVYTYAHCESDDVRKVLACAGADDLIFEMIMDL